MVKQASSNKTLLNFDFSWSSVFNFLLTFSVVGTVDSTDLWEPGSTQLTQSQFLLQNAFLGCPNADIVNFFLKIRIEKKRAEHPCLQLLNSLRSTPYKALYTLMSKGAVTHNS